MSVTSAALQANGSLGGIPHQQMESRMQSQLLAGPAGGVKGLRRRRTVLCRAEDKNKIVRFEEAGNAPRDTRNALQKTFDRIWGIGGNPEYPSIPQGSSQSTAKRGGPRDEWGGGDNGEWGEPPKPKVDDSVAIYGLSRSQRPDPTPPRPEYPRWSNREVHRDEWLKPITDLETIRQKLFMSEEDAARLQEQEAMVNNYESKEAVKFAAFLVGAPLFTSWLIGITIVDPLLTKTLENPEAFRLSGMQEIECAHELHAEEKRLKMDVILKRAPPLTDIEVKAHMREHALELLEEKRFENKRGLFNLSEDMMSLAFGGIILGTETDGRRYLFRTSERIYDGISDTGKAFGIILIADILLGYHSEEGWTSLIRVLSAHWTLEPKESSVYLFVSFWPVLLDAFFKLWIFQGFVAKNPAGASTLKAMDRH